MIALDVIDADEWRAWRDLRLQALEEAPYAFGTRLSEWQGEGDTEPRWRDRLSSVPFNVVARIDGAAAGIVSATAPNDGAVALISMWVAPFARGRGVGDALVQAVLRWARDRALPPARICIRRRRPGRFAGRAPYGARATARINTRP